MHRIYKFELKNKHNGIGRQMYKFYDFTDTLECDTLDTLYYDLEEWADHQYNSEHYECKFTQVTDKDELKAIKEKLISEIDSEIKELNDAKQLLSNIKTD